MPRPEKQPFVWPPIGPVVAIESQTDYDGWPRGMPIAYFVFDGYEEYLAWSRQRGHTDTHFSVHAAIKPS